LSAKVILNDGKYKGAKLEMSKIVVSGRRPYYN
jgi:hypothetical protein